jgi:hypothetical protein
VVDIYKNGVAYEVEFFFEPALVVTVPAEDLEEVRG